jgi:hypothetical protein
MNWRSTVHVALLAVAAPTGAFAQCALDVIESGVAAYRGLDLESAREILEYALSLNERTSASCATENARALSYIGASHWLIDQPDSAAIAFTRAVVQAPQFRPDAVEFPPDVTTAFDDVRRRTPAVSVSLPEEVDIAPGDATGLTVGVTASTGHWARARILTAGGDPVLTLYEGPMAAGAQVTALQWSGRDRAGDAVESGRYELEIVSSDSASREARKVVVPLDVQTTLPAGSRADAFDATPFQPVQTTRADDGGVWGALATAGTGLIAGALVVGAPLVADGFPESRSRYVIGGSLGLAGIVGFLQGIRGRSPPAPVPSAAPPPLREARGAATVHIRVGTVRRVELLEPAARSGAGAAPGGGE